MASKLSPSIIDYRQIAKHYLVKNTSHPASVGTVGISGDFDSNLHGIKRHYTEAFCMRGNVYDNLLALADNEGNQEAIDQI